MARPNNMYQRIEQLIKTNGPTSLLDIIAALPDCKRGSVAGCVRQARGLRHGYENTKTMYVVDYKPQRGIGGNPSPIIALGNLPDKAPPEISHEECRRGIWKRWNDKVGMRRKAKRQAKTAGVRALQLIVEPIAPVNIVTKTVIRHECEDDVERHPNRRRKAA